MYKQIHKFFAVATRSFTRLGDHQATDRLCLIIRLNTFHVSWFQVTYMAAFTKKFRAFV